MRPGHVDDAARRPTRSSMPAMTALTITARDPGSRAPGGRAATATARSARRPSCHWPRRPPCAAAAGEVAALGYDGVLGDTSASPRPRPRAHRPRRPARLHRLAQADRHRLGRLSGLSRWATAASRTRSRPGADGLRRQGGVLAIRTRASTFAPTSTAAAILAPERRWRSRRRSARPRARLRRCARVPRRPQLHGALDGAHAPLAAPLPRLAPRARPGRQLVFASSSGVRGTSASASTSRRRGQRSTDRDRRLARRENRGVRGRRWATAQLDEERPRHLLGSGDQRPRAPRRAGRRRVQLRQCHPAPAPRRRPGARRGAPLARRSRAARWRENNSR